jgi:hypothetical protein
VVGVNPGPTGPGAAPTMAAGMDVTDFPNDLVQTQAACYGAYDALAAPRPRAPLPSVAACCSCPCGCGGTPTGRRSPRCRRRAPSSGRRPEPGEPTGRVTGTPRTTRSMRLRQGLRLSVALDVAPRFAPTVAHPAGAPSRPWRSPRGFAVVGPLTSPLRPLCPCPLAGVKGQGGMGGTAAAGEPGRTQLVARRRGPPRPCRLKSSWTRVREGGLGASHGLTAGGVSAWIVGELDGCGDPLSHGSRCTQKL